MRVVAHPIEHPAALAFVDNDAVLFIKVGLLAPAIIAFLDRLLGVVKITA